MTIFRRNGQPAAVPDDDVHGHERVLSDRRNETIGLISQVRTRIATLEEEHGASLLEGRFEDHAAAADLLESARTECHRLEAAAAALHEAQQAVNRERQQRDMQTRIAECDQAREEAMARCQQRLADLPVIIAEAQQVARAALADEQDLQEAEREAKLLRAQLAHFDDPQFSVPRIVLSAPVTAAFERNPEYRSLANGTWYTGLAAPAARQ